MKALMITILLAAFLPGCNNNDSKSDQNFQDHQDTQSTPHYNRNLDPNVNSLSNQPATGEGL